MGQIESRKHKLKDGREVLIRTVGEADAESFLNLGKSIMSEDIYSMTQADELTLTIEQEAKWLKSNVESPNHLILVAEVDSHIVGQLDFSNGHKKRISHTGEFGMGVHAEFRGQGVGSFLLEALVAWAKSNQTIEKVNLCVHHTNERAIAMYEKHSFKKEGLRTKDLRYSCNEYVDTVLMGLQL